VVRKTLGVGPHDRVVLSIHEGGQVEVTKAERENTHPIVDNYLAFLERDMKNRPEKLLVITQDNTVCEILPGVETDDFDLSN